MATRMQQGPREMPPSVTKPAKGNFIQVQHNFSALFTRQDQDIACYYAHFSGSQCLLPLQNGFALSRKGPRLTSVETGKHFALYVTIPKDFLRMALKSFATERPWSSSLGPPPAIITSQDVDHSSYFRWWASTTCQPLCQISSPSIVLLVYYVFSPQSILWCEADDTQECLRDHADCPFLGTSSSWGLTSGFRWRGGVRSMVSTSLSCSHAGCPSPR